MIISFFSNYLNIHQLPFCEEIIKHVGEENFHFVANTKMDEDRVRMGFEDMNVTKHFVIRAYESRDAYDTACFWAKESDVAIFGSDSQVFQHIRLADNKLSFRYNERVFKQGLIRWFDPRVQILYRDLFTRYRKKDLFVLCASAYTKPDLRLLGFPTKKCYKWGYFPEMRPYPIFKRLLDKKHGMNSSGVSILWAGRLIGWKHPEAALSVADHLKRIGVEYSMKIIGDGPLRKMLEQKIADDGLRGNVLLLGAQKHEDVLKEMEKADIFIFTSDQNEGWGAVLNEAMNAGCAVVADKHIGSAPFLIKNGENGLLYSGKVSDLSEKVTLLSKNTAYRIKVAQIAWETINCMWSIKTATANLFHLIEELRNHREPIISEGPCSLA